MYSRLIKNRLCFFRIQKLGSGTGVILTTGSKLLKCENYKGLDYRRQLKDLKGFSNKLLTVSSLRIKMYITCRKLQPVEIMNKSGLNAISY